MSRKRNQTSDFNQICFPPQNHIYSNIHAPNLIKEYIRISTQKTTKRTSGKQASLRELLKTIMFAEHDVQRYFNLTGGAVIFLWKTDSGEI